MTDEMHRDEELGAALRALPVEDSRKNFWVDVERDLHAADAASLDAAQSESGHNEVSLGGGPLNENAGASEISLARQRWGFSSAKIMAAAAAVVLVVGGFIWALRPQSDTATELQVADQQETESEGDGDPSAGDSAETAEPADPDAPNDDIPSDDVTVETSPGQSLEPLTGTPVDLTQLTQSVALPIAMTPLAGSETSDVVLYAWTLPSSQGLGCEAFGSREAFVVLDSTGAQVSPVIGNATTPTLIQGPGAGIAIAEWCEGSIHSVHVGALTEAGVLRFDHFLRPPDGFAFSQFDPVWSADGQSLLVHLQDSSSVLSLGVFDRDSGESQVRPASGRVLAQLVPEASVIATSTAVSINDQQLLELGQFDGNTLRAEVSRDGRYVAITAGDALVVSDANGESYRFDTDGQAIWAMDWSPTGQLIFSVEDGTSLYSYDIAQPGEFNEALGLAGNWFEIEFASGGQILAVSGTSATDPTQTQTLILRLQGDAATAPQDGIAVFGATELTVGDSPLGLRGIGIVESGMTVAEVEAATGGKLVITSDLGQGCAHAVLAGDPNSPRFMVTTYGEDGPDLLEWSDGTIARIELGEGATTISGIGIGSTKAEALAAYGDRIEVSPHKYTSEQGGEYLTFVPVSDEDSGYRLVMETLNDTVTAIRSGLTEPVQWVEGCA